MKLEKLPSKVMHPVKVRNKVDKTEAKEWFQFVHDKFDRAWVSPLASRELLEESIRKNLTIFFDEVVKPCAPGVRFEFLLLNSWKPVVNTLCLIFLSRRKTALIKATGISLDVVPTPAWTRFSASVPTGLRHLDVIHL